MNAAYVPDKHCKLMFVVVAAAVCCCAITKTRLLKHTTINVVSASLYLPMDRADFSFLFIVSKNSEER